MSGRKNLLITFGFAVSVSLIASAFAVILVSHHYSRLQFDLLNAVCGEVLEQKPDTKEVIFSVLKEY